MTDSLVNGDKTKYNTINNMNCIDVLYLLTMDAEKNRIVEKIHKAQSQ